MELKKHPGVTVTAGLRGASWDVARMASKPYTMVPYPLITADGQRTLGFLFSRGGEKTVVCMMHPREMIVTNYLVPDVLDAGCACWVQGPRAVGRQARHLAPQEEARDLEQELSLQAREGASVVVGYQQERGVGGLHRRGRLHDRRASARGFVEAAHALEQERLAGQVDDVAQRQEARVERELALAKREQRVDRLSAGAVTEARVADGPRAELDLAAAIRRGERELARLPAVGEDLDDVRQ